MTPLRQFFACGVLGTTLALVSGCSVNSAVPPDASLMTAGTTTAKFKPTVDGRVYILDRTSGNILYQGDVDRGEMVELDARDDRITIAGNTVSDRTLDDGHDFEIRFKSHPQTARSVEYRVEEP